MKKGLKIFLYVCLGLFLVALLMPSKPSVAKAIAKDSNFHYATSITGRVDRSDKAKVYTTSMSVPAAAQYIMKTRRPESYSDLKNKESIQLVYDDYYVLIYKGQNAKTYVQTSSRKYVHQNGYYGLYRPHHAGLILLANRHYSSGGYANTDSQRYGRGFNQSTTTTNSSKIQTDKDASSKIRTDSSSSNKIRTSSGSVRAGSTSSRASVGGGTSFGK